MLSKKIFLSAAFVSMAGLVACGDDSSSNSNSKELPKSVPTFFDLADVECNADRKCETIIVENGPDTYECDGKQWNMLINSMPSKVCPAEEEKKSEEGAEEGGNSSEGLTAAPPLPTARKLPLAVPQPRRSHATTLMKPVSRLSAPWEQHVRRLMLVPWRPLHWNFVVRITTAPWAQVAPPSPKPPKITAKSPDPPAIFTPASRILI